MSIQLISKLAAGIIFFSILLVGAMLFWAISEIFNLVDTTINGIELIASLRKMNGLTNKLLSTDNLNITYLWWEIAADEFTAMYNTFNNSPRLGVLLRDEDILYNYKAFRILSQRALNSIEVIKSDIKSFENFPNHENQGILLQPLLTGNENVSVIAFSIREISTYFSTSYENTITPLVASLKEKSRQIQLQILRVFVILTLGIITVTIFLYLVLKKEEIKRKTQLQHMESEKTKLESIGLLASGIAHDFNNFLTAIMGNISIAKTRIPQQNELFTILNDAEKASLQAKSLTGQFLTFATGGSPIKKLEAVQGIIRETCTFILRGSNIRCEYNLPDDLWNTEIDKDKICEVIDNIVLNSMQAMPEGGIITVNAENVTITKKHPKQYQPGRYVHISIKDTGSGIPEVIKHHIFNPYFTTKKQGSGLGLSVSYSIIKKHQGYLDFESEQGVGTTFHIYLKASLKQLQSTKSIAKEEKHGHGCVLLMDDEEGIRKTTSLMLHNLGYTTLVAKDGDEAIKLYSDSFKNNNNCKIAILDLTIRGGISGERVLKTLLAINPGVTAIVSSGYSNNDILSEYRKHGFKGILKKPYTINELSQVLELAQAEDEKDD
ncbi:MAG: response regulator [Spirochaetales bacterium]|nr:response regulator [Spirochaetales bacterium]